MNDNFRTNKSFRLMLIKEKLEKGEIIYKNTLLTEYGIVDKTFQRDLENLRAYYADVSELRNINIIYDRKRNGYVLENSENEFLDKKEVLAVCKILLESRAFCKHELDKIIKKLLSQVNTIDKKLVDNIIANENFNYIPLKHDKELVSTIWELMNFITKCDIIEINYTRSDKTSKIHKVKPVSIMFSEFYFYLIAYMSEKDLDYPIVFRIDRINSFKTLKTKFKIPHKDKFSDIEFRKRVLFMYNGPLQIVTFEFTGVIEALLDKLPTAKILNDDGNGLYKIRAESYGDGIFMRLRSQGDLVKILD